MKTELCAYSVDACRIAARLGVDRVELCASPAEGGVTPSMATIERVAAIEGIDVSVMIRPRGGDFLYSDDEFRTMLRDIAYAREAGATGCRPRMHSTSQTKKVPTHLDRYFLVREAGLEPARP